MCRRKTESFSSAEFEALLDEEAEGVRRLYAQGIVRSAWTREDVLGACLMLEVETLASAHEAVAGLPLGRRGMLEVQLVPLRGYRGFGPRNP
ncbi:MAG TPA: hypothetical protein VNF68_13575 [Candidatus Baltobacteraceae bacterium]|nr:hypothetical protein [Candidatus Baltobacteraceae bacterium]